MKWQEHEDNSTYLRELLGGLNVIWHIKYIKMAEREYLTNI